MQKLQQQDGMALLLVLALTALLSALVGEMAFNSYVDLRLVETFRDQTRAEYVARGGIDVGRHMLSSDTNEYDGATEMWAQGIPNYPVGDIGSISIEIEAEDGKVNLNNLVGANNNPDAVTVDQCERLFDILGIPDPQAHVDALIDWIDADDDPRPVGAEAGYYAAQPGNISCKNAPLDTLDELKVIAGFSAEEVETLRPHVSVYGSGKIHLNSATPEVLFALAQEMDLDTAALIAEQSRERPYRSLEELQLLPRWEDFYWAINTRLKVSADIYTIHSTAYVGSSPKRIIATLEKSSGKLLFLRIL
ncbi:MAG: type II secretion system minor pseudopilin GspK [Desulfuromonadaceae bacterium]